MCVIKHVSLLCLQDNDLQLVIGITAGRISVLVSKIPGEEKIAIPYTFITNEKEKSFLSHMEAEGHELLLFFLWPALRKEQFFRRIDIFI